jgi:hypothetical protein
VWHPSDALVDGRCGAYCFCEPTHCGPDAPMPRRFQFTVKRIFGATASLAISSLCLARLVDAIGNQERSAPGFLAAAIIAFELGMIALFAENQDRTTWSVGMVAIAAVIGLLFLFSD